MREGLGRIRLAGATCQLLLGSRPRGPRVWHDENKAGVQGDCQTGGAKTIAIKGTWGDRCAKLSPSPDVLGWQQPPAADPKYPRPGPRRDKSKTLALQPFPACYANTLGAQTQLEAQGTFRDLDSSCRA